MKQTILKYSAHEDELAILSEIDQWQAENKVKRLWLSDASLWSNTDESKWTGWLDVAVEKQEIPRITVLAKELKKAGFTDLVVLGMGGSSLCPAMMATTFKKVARYPQLHILDSTDPMQIRDLEKKIDLKKSFFIVSSKSGSTLEPTIFKEYFFARLQTVLETKDVGDRFAAITDPGSQLEAMAKKDNFKAIFHGVPSIGGRYSALSNFGMVPSGLMGLDLDEFLAHVDTMHAACAPTTAIKENPGVMLGMLLGVCGKRGKDKITLIASPEIHALGAWLEQLLAESTGKIGKGLIPVDQEPLGKPAVYGHDRLFVYIRLTSAPDNEQDRKVLELERNGHVVVRLDLADKMHLGGELFRWEVATAVAGSILGINPFNQPDVEDSKVITAKLTTEYEKTGKLNLPTAFFSADGLSLFTDEKNLQDIQKNLKGEPSLLGFLTAHLSRVKENDYVNLSAFIEMSDEHTDLLQRGRVHIRDTKKVATCLGFGPRFLHSTGQAYKGGPNTGVFLQITADYPDDLPVPDHRYTFGVVIAAQAQGDFTVLANRDRRVLQIHLGGDVKNGLQKLIELIQGSCEPVN